MKKTVNRIKTALAALRTAILIFPFKAKSQMIEQDPIYASPTYFAEKYQMSPRKSAAMTSIKIAQRTLIGITLIFGIINLIKIKKTDDKVQKKVMTKNFITVIIILICLIVACLITIRLLKK